MSSMTFDRPAPRVRVVPDNLDNLDNKIGYSSLLAARDAVAAKVRGVGTFIAAAAASAVRGARLLADHLHLRRVGTLAATAASWTLERAAVPLGLLRRVLTPAGALWALTTATGQRLTGTVLRTSLRLLESVLMGGTDLMMVVLGRCGRMGRWVAGAVGNAWAGVVLAVAKVADKVRTTVGPWVSADRLHVRVVNALAGLVFLRQLSGLLLPPVLQLPAMVVAMVVSIARSGRDGVARSLRSLARVLADVAEATFVAAGVMDEDVPVTVGVGSTEGPSITVQVPQPGGVALQRHQQRRRLQSDVPGVEGPSRGKRPHHGIAHRRHARRPGRSVPLVRQDPDRHRGSGRRHQPPVLLDGRQLRLAMEPATH